MAWVLLTMMVWREATFRVYAVEQSFRDDAIPPARTVQWGRLVYLKYNTTLSEHAQQSDLKPMYLWKLHKACVNQKLMQHCIIQEYTSRGLKTAQCILRVTLRCPPREKELLHDAIPFTCQPPCCFPDPLLIWILGTGLLFFSSLL